jgi:hypothetical protein
VGTTRAAKIQTKGSVTENERNEPSTAILFGAVWDALTDLMGSSATATLVRRAAKRASSTKSDIRLLTIHRPAFEYEYVVPERWNDDGHGRDELDELMLNLVPLLAELTGTIAIRRLQSISILVSAGVLQGEDDDGSRS